MKSSCKIPSEREWGDYESDEDANYSHMKFVGKSLEDALPCFKNHVLEACDELRFMPGIPFRYYMLAFRNYVISKGLLSNDMASDATSSFLDLIVEKLAKSPESIRPILGELMPAVEYVANNQTLFNADKEIYGDFLDRLVGIKRHVQ